MSESIGYIPPGASGEIEPPKSPLEEGQQFIDVLKTEDQKGAAQSDLLASPEGQWSESDKQERIRNGLIFWGSAATVGGGLIYGANRLAEAAIPYAEKMMQQQTPESLAIGGIATAALVIGSMMGARAGGRFWGSV